MSSSSHILAPSRCCRGGGDLPGAAGQVWREVGRLLGVHKHIVIASTLDAMPPQSARSLKRALTQEGGDADDDARTTGMRQEREATWETPRSHAESMPRWHGPTC